MSKILRYNKVKYGKNPKYKEVNYFKAISIRAKLEEKENYPGDLHLR